MAKTKRPQTGSPEAEAEAGVAMVAAVVAATPMNPKGLATDELMAAYAKALRAAHGELDGSLGSLAALERLIEGKPVGQRTTYAWGAYLGEVIRAQRPDEIRWVSFAEASAATTMIADLPPGYDIEAILRVGRGGFWFPLAKIEKRQRNGVADALEPFAGVVLGSLPRRSTPQERERDRAIRAEAEARVEALGRAFAAAPTGVGLVAFDRAAWAELGDPGRAANLPVMRRLGIAPRSLVALLGEAATGRGYQRVDVGHCAAVWLAMLAITGAAARDAVMAATEPALAAKAPGAGGEARRTNAAYARTYIDARGGSEAEALVHADSGDAARIAGALRALHAVANDWRMNEYAPNLSFAPLAAMVAAALAKKSPHLDVALDLTWTWIDERGRARAIEPILGELRALAAKSRPTAMRRAAEILEKYDRAR